MSDAPCLQRRIIEMRKMIKMMAIVTCLSVVFAIAAAILWFVSARVNTPEFFHIISVQVGGGVGSGHSPDLEKLAEALKKQSKFSAWAAICAGESAILQAILIGANKMRCSWTVLGYNAYTPRLWEVNAYGQAVAG